MIQACPFLDGLVYFKLLIVIISPLIENTPQGYGWSKSLA
jgi:hypothetical protein